MADFNLQTYLSEMRAEAREDTRDVSDKVDTGFEKIGLRLTAHEKDDLKMFGDQHERLKGLEDTHKNLKWLVRAAFMAFIVFGFDMLAHALKGGF